MSYDIDIFIIIILIIGYFTDTWIAFGLATLFLKAISCNFIS